jgi:hypothetical protein
MKNKLGEITTQQIVLIIVLIASFAIIMFFMAQLNLGQSTEKELCHNSVVSRGSSVLPADSVPLNCKRSYLCLTEDGSCEQMTNPIKEKVKTEAEVYEVLSRELADCWWMFGEGEINYVGSDFLSKNYCSICSQIAFDDSMNEIIEEGVVYEDLVYAYMEENKIPNKDKTYLEYLYKINDFSVIKQEFIEKGLEFGKIDLNKQYYIMMGIKSDVSTKSWIASGAVLGIVTLVASPITTGIISGIIFSSAGGGVGKAAVSFFVNGDSGNEYLSPSIIEVNSNEFENLECNSIITLS